MATSKSMQQCIFCFSHIPLRKMTTPLELACVALLRMVAPAPREARRYMLSTRNPDAPALPPADRQLIEQIRQGVDSIPELCAASGVTATAVRQRLVRLELRLQIN